jgi:hypothetical protein
LALPALCRNAASILPEVAVSVEILTLQAPSEKTCSGNTGYFMAFINRALWLFLLPPRLDAQSVLFRHYATSREPPPFQPEKHKRRGGRECSRHKEGELPGTVG